MIDIKESLLYRCASCSEPDDPVEALCATTWMRVKIICSGCGEQMEWVPKYPLGPNMEFKRVWLAEFDNGGEIVPREPAIVNPQLSHPGMYSASVAVGTDMYDDCERELDEWQIEGPCSEKEWNEYVKKSKKNRKG